MIFAIWLFLALTAVALIRLRRAESDLPRPYRAWGYPLTPLLFAAVACAISVNLWLRQPIRSSIGLAVIILGIPFFYHWRRGEYLNGKRIEAHTDSGKIVVR